jgi:hypothetical protein
MKTKTPNPEQQAAKLARRERFKAIVKQVAEMTDGQRVALTQSVGAVLSVDGRAMSLHNTCLLITQYPGVSLVGGFRQWLAQGRCVQKGQHGLMIWVPVRRKSKAVEETGDSEAEDRESQESQPGFIVGTVFDVKQPEALKEESPSPVIDLSAVAFTPAWRRLAA